MNISGFAKAYRLRTIGDRKAIKAAMVPDGNPKPDSEHIPGKRGWITDAGTVLSAFIKTHRAADMVFKAQRIGMELAARGDTEIGLYFDPHDPAQADFAIRAIKAKRKRQTKVTPEVLTRLKRAREAQGMPVLA
jgi:hypothetical protein